MTSPAGTTHILVIPYPAQGHLIPILDLTHSLLLRGLTVTIVVTTTNLPFLKPLLSRHPSSAVSTLVLPFPYHPSLPSGVENIQDLPPNSVVPVMDALRRLHDPITQWFKSHRNPPAAVLSDMFLGWTQGLAESLRIKRIVFSPSGALAVSVMHSLWKNVPDLPDSGNDVFTFNKIPGTPRFEGSEISGFYRSYRAGAPGTRFLREQFVENMRSWGFVFNTFTGLERDYLAHMMDDLGHERVWAVGPLSELGCRPVVGNGADCKVLDWLDRCGDAEVVYVSFGSQTVLTNEQMEVLAGGLERSGVRFVWKVKVPTDAQVDGDKFGKVPHGFEDRVGSRGLVVREWAPQVMILRHRAVGAFLTHCGWNSVLEGLSAGVMMLAWPLGADQFSDSVLLVDNLKVGVRVDHGTKSLPDPDELGKILAGSVSGACKEHRMRAFELKKMAKEAISEGGGSLRELDGFVKHLSQLPIPTPHRLSSVKPDAFYMKLSGKESFENEEARARSQRKFGVPTH